MKSSKQLACYKPIQPALEVSDNEIRLASCGSNWNRLLIISLLVIAVAQAGNAVWIDHGGFRREM